jgi:hypothetical protein
MSNDDYSTLSWSDALDTEVRSIDDKDLGKVKSITNDYLIVREGTVSKNYYAIPKYFVAGYGEDKIWISLKKDTIKSRFERDKDEIPPISEFETPDYVERRNTLLARYPNFDSTIPSFILWDKIIGKNMKTSDDKKLGEIKSVSPDYIEVEKGKVDKKRYYIPKYYVDSFDGKNAYTSLTKDKAEAKYYRDAPPAASEFQAREYLEHRRSIDTTYPQYVYGVPFMAKEPPTEIPVDYSGTTYNLPWDKLINKRIRTADNNDIGYVARVGHEFIVAREGVTDTHTYYIPKTYIRGFTGGELWVDLPVGLARAKFERDTEPSQEELRSLAREAPRVRQVAPESTVRQAPGEPSKVVIEHEVDLDEIEAEPE